MLKPKALLKNNLASTFLYQAHLWQANKVTTLFGCLKAGLPEQAIYVFILRHKAPFYTLGTV